MTLQKIEKKWYLLFVNTIHKYKKNSVQNSKFMYGTEKLYNS